MKSKNKTKPFEYEFVIAILNDEAQKGICDVFGVKDLRVLCAVTSNLVQSKVSHVPMTRLEANQAGLFPTTVCQGYAKDVSVKKEKNQKKGYAHGKTHSSVARAAKH